MSLRDTLRAATERAEAEARAVSEKPKIIAEWKAAIDDFNTQIHEWLKPLEEDGAIIFRKYTIELREEFLGTYEASALDMKAGPYQVHIRPIGRLIFGAFGRIDMFRQGFHIPDSNPRFIRQQKEGRYEWFIRKPQHQISSSIGAMASRGSPELIPLDAQSFEATLDALLQ